MASLEDIKVQLKQLDNRLVTEIVGKNIIVSKILEETSTAFNQNTNVEEVRILAAESVQIDADLKNDAWHGKNITVVTKSINVSKAVTWDVSGKDNVHIYPDNAGTDADGDGVDGNDGFPGESGGNVLILANRIENAEKLAIISNGGKGSKGQDGGNGKNGKNGKGITSQEFKEMFPPTAIYHGPSRYRAIIKTLQTLSNDTRIVTEWAKLPFETPITQDVFSKKKDDLQISDIFIEVVNKEGNEITFSFGFILPIAQSFLLFKGAPGKTGGSGGVKGLGGQGGYPGEIMVKNVTTNQVFPVNKFGNQGDEGEPGRGGLFGNHGTNGNDMAYADYSATLFSFESWPKYYGMDGNSKLSLNFNETNDSERIYCPYKNYIGSDDTYCSISSSSNEQKSNKKYQERNSNIRNERKHHALATRKKTIMENRLRAAFSDFLNVIKEATKLAEMQRKSTVSAVEVAPQTITNAASKTSGQSRTEAKSENINLATTPSKPTVQHQTQQTYANTNEKKYAQPSSSHATKTSMVEKSHVEMGNLKQDTSLSKVITQKQEIHKSTLSVLEASYQNVSQNKQQEEKVKIQNAEQAKLKVKNQTQQISSDTSDKISAQTTSSNSTQQTAEPKLDITKQIALQLGPTTAEDRQDRNFSKISEIVIATQNNVEEITKNQQEILETLVEVNDKDVKQNTRETEAQENEEHWISLNTIEENQENNLSDEQDQTLESNITRHVEFVHEVDKTPRQAIQLNAKFESSDGEFSSVDLLNIDLKKIENWFILRRHIHSREDLQNLFHIFETNKKCLIENESINQSVVLQLLIEKYRLVTFEAINKQFPIYDDDQEETQLTAEEACMYLTVDATEDTKISHPVLGRLNPYIQENSQDHRKKLSRYCCNDLKDNIDMVKQTLVLEIGHLEESPDCIKTVYDEYKIVETQREDLDPELDEFERLLTQPKYADILRLWKMRSVEGSTNKELENQIQSDSVLNSLWEHLNDQYEFQYDWSKCYSDKTIFDCLCKHIKNTGFESKTYRELLALIFDINLRIYEKDYEDDLILLENLNTTSKIVVYCFRQATGFVQIGINKNHVKLQHERQKKDKIYKNILTKISTLKHKEDLEKCLTSQTFWYDNSEQFSNVVDPQLILQYFPEEERHEVNVRLSKMRPEYIRQEGIVYHLLSRFSCEGRHVSCEEMYFLINSIFSHCLEGGHDQYTFAWLIAAYPQRNWTDELILLHLETHFKEQLKEKPKWREYLSRIQNKEVLILLGGKLDQAQTLTIDRMDTVLYLLSNIHSGSVFLEELELPEWPYVLKEKYWLNKLDEDYNVKGDDDTSVASYYVLSIENMYGTELVENLLKILNEKIRAEGVSSNLFITILSYFHNGKWNLSDADLQTLQCISFNEWMETMNVKNNSSAQDERNISQLVELIICNANSSELVKKNLPNIERSIIEINTGKYEIKKNIVNNLIPLSIVDYEPNTKMVNKFTENDIQIWAKHFNARNYKIEVGDLQEILAVIVQAVVLKRGFKLRDTQKLTVLTLLANNRSILSQVSTGEGKSLIVVAASIMKALFGEKVDIVTSSSVLAKRDAENNSDIYNLFGISVSHNCNENIGKRKEAYVLSQVVYGDLGSFQRDYLLDRFYGKNMFGDRDFANVIVDEVDSMLVDKGNNMLYLSHDIPWMDKLESVYLFIWQQINSLEEIDIETDDDVNSIEEAVLSDMYGIILEKDIAKIDVKLSDRERKEIWSRLVNAKILDEQGRLMIESIKGLNLSKSLTSKFSRYIARISFLLQETIERNRLIPIPNYLRSFVERHLKQWINSAITAFYMNPGHNYVVDVDRTGTSSDRNGNIIILDKDTGTDQANSQWAEGLHQFLQLKHACKLSMLSLKAVFISNVSYFKLYRQLYGLTGTLGSEPERDLLQKIHQVDFVTIPTSRAKQFHEELPIVCCERGEWIKSVCYQAHFVYATEKRSVLVICDTVKDAKDIHKGLGGKEATNVHRYVRDYEEFTVVKDDKKLEQGQVIVATNLAGRGTDIKITDALRNVGGLHVLLTYLPGNKRIEEQAFGRAARSGDKGSGQLIIFHSRGMEYSNAKVLGLKKTRDIEEVLRVSEINCNYNNRIIAEETCFNKFKDLYERKRKALTDAKVPDEVIKILLASCLDKWAFWLDEQNKNIILEQGDSVKNQFEEKLTQFMSKLRYLRKGIADTILHDYDTSAWLPWVDGNPAQMVELAKLLCEKSYWRSFSFGYQHRYENSVKLLDNVIQNEPQFAEAAHYYKAYALAINGDTTDKSLLRQFKRELRVAAKLFEEHSKLAMHSATIVGQLVENCEEEKNRIENGYEKQKRNIIDIYSTFIRSIDDILGKLVTPQSFENHDIDDQLAAYLIHDLLQHGILKNMKLKMKNISIATLKQAVKDLPGTISVKMLETFLLNYGRSINEKNFVKALKNAIEIPGRERFWKILVNQKALQDIVSYVIVDYEKINAVDPSMLDFIREKLNDNTLKKQTIANTEEQIMLYVEHIINRAEKEAQSEEMKVEAKDLEEELVFFKEEFIAVVSKEKYTFLKENAVLSFNKQGTINKANLDKIVFPCFDSISINDFVEKTSITRSEAEIILSELADSGILRKRSEPNQHTYEFAKNFDELRQDEIPSCAAYEPVVQVLLEACFSYRLALQKLKRQLDERITPVRLELNPQPHKKLVFHLMDHRIIIPVKVMNGEIEKAYKQAQSSKKGVKKKSEVLYNNDKTTAIRVNHESKLTNDNVINHVANTLKALRGSIKAFDVPQPTLTSLYNVYGQSNFGNIEEIRIFTIDGLHQLINLQEKKWTVKMLRNTFSVVAIGLAQIAVGAIIELYYAGFMAHVGAAFINEGVNDLMYAVGALKSGYFSWQEFGKHKIQSVAITVASMGVAGFLSRGAKVSRYGRKLAGPGFKYAEKEVMNTSGKQLIKAIGWKVATKEVTKRIVLKSAESIVFGMTNSMVDTAIETYLQNTCDKIGNAFITQAMKAIDDHSISNRLEEVYNTLGVDKAKQMMDEITNSAFSEQNIFESYGPAACKVRTAFVQGFSQGIAKQSKVGINSKIPISTICKAVSFIDKAMEIGNVALFAYKFLDNIDQQMAIKLKNLKDEKKQDNQLQVNEMDQEYLLFRDEIIQRWKGLLSQKVGNVISQQIAAPIIRHCSTTMVKLVGDQIKKGYNTLKERKLEKEFNKTKDTHAHPNKDSRGKTSEQTKKYHDKLLKLLRKTRNPALVAAIIQENIPMDFTCVKACSFVLPHVLKNSGVNIEGLAIKVVGEKGIEQSFCSVPEEKIQKTLTITLKENHYTLSETGSQNQSLGTNNGGNDCLFTALSDQFPELQKLGAKQFRQLIAQSIIKEPELQHHIRKGYHNLPIKLGAYGGRRKADVIEESSSTADTEHFEGAQHINKSEFKHFCKRFETSVLFNGLVRKFATETAFNHDDLVESGKSVYQDRVSKEKGYVQAHLIKAGKINPNFERKHPEMTKMLKNALGRTQKMRYSANVNKGFGGDCDKIQQQYAHKLRSIDFSKPLTADAEVILNDYKNAFSDCLNNRIIKIKNELSKSKPQTLNIEKQSQLYTFTAIENRISSFSPAYLHQLGNVKISGKKVNKYKGQAK